MTRLGLVGLRRGWFKVANEGGSPCRFRSGQTLMPMRCARLPARRRTARKRGAFWPWPRSMRGRPATEAARIGGVTVQIVRDWVVKFNAQGPEGLVNRKPPGQPSKLTDAHRAALVARVDAGPIPAVHGVVRWRLVDLIAWIWEEFRLSLSKQTLS